MSRRDLFRYCEFGWFRGLETFTAIVGGLELPSPPSPQPFLFFDGGGFKFFDNTQFLYFASP